MIEIICVGMDEMEFTEAESNMNDLIAEYQTYQVKKKYFFPSTVTYFPNFWYNTATKYFVLFLTCSFATFWESITS